MPLLAARKLLKNQRMVTAPMTTCPCGRGQGTFCLWLVRPQKRFSDRERLGRGGGWL